MRILLIGASGTIGGGITKALAGHELLTAGRTSGAHQVDITNQESIAALFKAVGQVDAVVCAAGAAKFAPLDQLAFEDYRFSIHGKLMSQVNLTRLALPHVADGGSITLTSGILARQPMPGGAAISMVNAGLEGFVGAAALELPRGIRINVVSPGWVSETLAAMKMDPSRGAPAAAVGKAYQKAVTGSMNGQVITAVGG